MRFLMHGLDDADLQLGKFIDNLCYLTIHCREIGSRAEERLGRLNLTLQDAQRILSLPDPYGVCQDMAAEEEEEEEEEDTNEPDDPTQVRRVLLKASRRFIRLTLARTSVNKKALRFRVRGYGPKGDEPSPLNLTINVEDSRVASLRDSDEPLYDETDDPPDEPAPAPGRPKPNAAPTVAPLPSQHDPSGIKGPTGQAMRELSLCYADFAHLLLGSWERNQSINDGMHQRLSHELSQSRKQVDALAGAVLEHRIQQLEIAERAVDGERSARSRSDLASQAVKELGDAAKSFLGGGGLAGLPPELLGAVAPLLQHPELRALLGDPTVLGLLRDPRFLGDLAAMLRNVAAQAKAAQQKAGTPPPPPPPPA
ncbi:MAG: hypothetical protein IPI35_17750 [Deltaproteobacteria bacterium]|nr:hypothetical protein [Deltaproteobacteria bacterium]